MIMQKHDRFDSACSGVLGRAALAQLPKRETCHSCTKSKENSDQRFARHLHELLLIASWRIDRSGASEYLFLLSVPMRLTSSRKPLSLITVC